MFQAGKAIQFRLTIRENIMEKEKNGMMMEAYTLENTRIMVKLMERSMSCKQILLTHYTLLSMMIKRKRLRKNK